MCQNRADSFSSRLFFVRFLPRKETAVTCFLSDCQGEKTWVIRVLHSPQVLQFLHAGGHVLVVLGSQVLQVDLQLVDRRAQVAGRLSLLLVLGGQLIELHLQTVELDCDLAALLWEEKTSQ